MRRDLLALVVLALLTCGGAASPLATAQSAGGDGDGPVEIVEVELPDRTVANKPFPVSLTLRNTGDVEVSVSLFGVIYPKTPDAESPCGPIKENGGKFTHLIQPVFQMGPGQTVTFPPADEPEWLQQYTSSDAPAEPALREFCVFAFEPEREGSLTYYDYASLGLNVRRNNEPPTGDFSWTPQRGAAAQPVAFSASATDADGDPVTYRWDFGRHTASGRATAQGPEASHAFYPAGTYTVTLVLSDGFDETRVQHEVVVGPEPAAPADLQDVEGEPDDGSGSSLIPVPWPLTLVAVAAAAVALAARARRPRGGC